MTDSTLRTAIARALYDLYWTKYQNKDGAWCEGNWLLSKIEREEYLEEADTVLKVIADPPAKVVERVEEAIYSNWELQDDGGYGIDTHAVLAALGGENDE